MTLRLDLRFEYKFVSSTLHSTYPELGAVTHPMAGSEVRPRCLSCDLVTRTRSPGTKPVYVCTCVHCAPYLVLLTSLHLGLDLVTSSLLDLLEGVMSVLPRHLVKKNP